MKADVSALLDDALEDHSQSSVLDALCRDAQLRQTWSEYQLIGDALRRAPRLSSDLTARVMAQLADEPTMLAPTALRRRRSAAMRYLLPLAASVMGVAAVAWVAQTREAPDAVRIAAAPPTAAPKAVEASAAAAAVQPRAATDVALAEQPEFAKPAQVKPYLFAHQGYSPVTGIQGAAHYVRIVSDTREGAAR